MKVLICLIALIIYISASPFLITEKYIEEFQNGINELKKVFHEYQFGEEAFDPAHFDETAALTEAEEYDFIIIGAGASGSVLANRLSEIPEWKILLLEAGGHETEYTQIPKFYGLLGNSPYNWGYTTVPQKTWCQGMIDKKCTIETGKVLGGSTGINGMIFTRGNVKDYDEWADLGNDGWCYEDVLPYFKKLEDAHLDHYDRKYHNHGGPVHIENVQYTTKLAENVLLAGKELGMETLVDYNGKDQLGLAIPQVTTKNGKRNSAAQSYLKEAEKRSNLKIQPNSRVIKIIISEHSKEATGVKYVHDGKLFIAKANKEVILSAGTINTPQILMLSGIGPKEELEKHHIHSFSDLAVGKNFKDHIGFAGLNFVFNETKVDESNEKDDLINYLKNGKGPLTSIGAEIVGYIQTEISKNKPHYPDVELVFIKKAYDGDFESHKVSRITEETYNSYWKPIEGKTGFGIYILLAHPKSSGTVTLKDDNPFHYPLIDANQLSDPDDHDILTVLAAIRECIKISHSESLQKLGITLNDHQIHGCEDYEFNSDDYWKCAIRHLSISLRHLSGTARMGPKTDKEAVVDNKLNVYGVHKLRVADASVIPVTITGHTMAPALMIGEKASDLIKHDWKH